MGAVRSPRRSRALVGLAAVVITACEPSTPDPRAITLVGFKPRVTTDVFLNEDLEFVFSHEIDPATVTQQTFRVRDEEGAVASGTWRVVGRRLLFHPAPVLLADLTGGGYRPATRYTVEFVGFPSLSSIRSVEGWPLDRSRRYEFETVRVDPANRRVVFDDASPGSAAPVNVSTALGRLSQGGGWQLEADDPIVLTCAEPLDPSSLRAEDFWLFGPGDPGASERIAVSARFVANYDEGEAPHGESAAVLELLATRHLSPGSYELVISRGVELHDFGGNPVWPMGLHNLVERLEVVPYGDSTGFGATEDLTIDFVGEDRHLFTLLRVPEADGTLTWEAGRATVRYPAAAGDGHHGRQALLSSWPGQGWEGDTLDLHATRIELPADQEVEIEASGPVILRSQGSIALEGRLRRRTPPPGCPEVTENLANDKRTLSAWLEEVVGERRHWTILIAGGDLLLGPEAVVDVDTPLLMVVGGQIRLDSRARLLAPEKEVEGLSRPKQVLYTLGDRIPIEEKRTEHSLVLDPPTSNPLREEVRFSVLTAPLPQALRACSLASEPGRPVQCHPRISGRRGRRPLPSRGRPVHPGGRRERSPRARRPGPDPRLDRACRAPGFVRQLLESALDRLHSARVGALLRPIHLPGSPRDPDPAHAGSLPPPPRVGLPRALHRLVPQRVHPPVAARGGDRQQAPALPVPPVQDDAHVA